MPKINPKLKNSPAERAGKKLRVNNHKPDLEKTVMEKIKSGQIEMKPKWYFVAGSLFMTIGLISLTVGAIFLTNLTIFLIRKKGPGYGRLEMMLASFPWWIPVLTVLGVVLGVLLLKKYDFSYKKNFVFIVAVFIISIIIAAFAIDYFGLNDIWSRRGPMKRLYQQIENQEYNYPKGQGRMQYNNISSRQLEKN